MVKSSEITHLPLYMSGCLKWSSWRITAIINAMVTSETAVSRWDYPTQVLRSLTAMLWEDPCRAGVNDTLMQNTHTHTRARAASRRLHHSARTHTHTHTHTRARSRCFTPPASHHSTHTHTHTRPQLSGYRSDVHRMWWWWWKCPSAGEVHLFMHNVVNVCTQC